MTHQYRAPVSSDSSHGFCHSCPFAPPPDRASPGISSAFLLSGAAVMLKLPALHRSAAHRDELVVHGGVPVIDPHRHTLIRKERRRRVQVHRIPFRGPIRITSGDRHGLQPATMAPCPTAPNRGPQCSGFATLSWPSSPCSLSGGCCGCTYSEARCPASCPFLHSDFGVDCCGCLVEIVSATRPQGGRVNEISGFSEVFAFVCRNCGKGAAVD